MSAISFKTISHLWNKTLLVFADFFHSERTSCINAQHT